MLTTVCRFKHLSHRKMPALMALFNVLVLWDGL